VTMPPLVNTSVSTRTTPSPAFRDRVAAPYRTLRMQTQPDAVTLALPLPLGDRFVLGLTTAAEAQVELESIPGFVESLREAQAEG
jgi:hypothetical protein